MKTRDYSSAKTKACSIEFAARVNNNIIVYCVNGEKSRLRSIRDDNNIIITLERKGCGSLSAE